MLLPRLLLGAVFTYSPSSLTFSSSDGGVSFSSLSSSLKIEEGPFTLGKLDFAELGKLFSPYGERLTLAGFSASDENAGFFLLSQPSFGGGAFRKWKWGAISGAYVSQGVVSDELFLHVNERGGYESLHLRGDITTGYADLFVKGSFSFESGFDFVYGGTISYEGLSFSYMEGELLQLEGGEGIRRRIEVGVKSDEIRYSAYIYWKSDPITAGAYRYHKGREEVSVTLPYGVTLASKRQSYFTTGGKLAASYQYLVNWKGLSVGFDEEDELILGYEDSTIRLWYESGSIRVRLSFTSGPLRISLSLTSEGVVTSTLRLDI